MPAERTEEQGDRGNFPVDEEERRKNAEKWEEYEADKLGMDVEAYRQQKQRESDQRGHGQARRIAGARPGADYFEGQRKGFDDEIRGRGTYQAGKTEVDPTATVDQQTKVDRSGLYDDPRARTAQQGLMDDLVAASRGQGPSLAQNQLKRATDRNLAQLMATQAAARGGPGGAAAQRQLQTVQGQVNQEAAAESSDLAMREQLAAREQLAGVTGQAREADARLREIDAQMASLDAQLEQARLQGNQQAINELNQFKAKLNQEREMFNTSMQAQLEQMRDQMRAQLLAMGYSAEEADRQARLAVEQMNLQEYGLGQQLQTQNYQQSEDNELRPKDFLPSGMEIKYDIQPIGAVSPNARRKGRSGGGGGLGSLIHQGGQNALKYFGKGSDFYKKMQSLTLEDAKKADAAASDAGRRGFSGDPTKALIVAPSEGLTADIGIAGGAPAIVPAQGVSVHGSSLAPAAVGAEATASIEAAMAAQAAALEAQMAAAAATAPEVASLAASGEEFKFDMEPVGYDSAQPIEGIAPREKKFDSHKIAGDLQGMFQGAWDQGAQTGFTGLIGVVPLVSDVNVKADVEPVGLERTFSDIRAKYDVSDIRNKTGVETASGMELKRDAMPMRKEEDPEVQFLRRMSSGFTTSDINAKTGVTMSDRSSKEGGQDADAGHATPMDNMLNDLRAYTFRYKEPEKFGPGKRLGIMAQDLERTELGEGLVRDTPEGKKVDVGGLANAAFASVIELHHRQEKMQAELDALRGKKKGK